MAHPDISLISEHPVNDAPDAHYVISNVRNELPRLPYWLSYYRKMGVDQFFIVDNGSTDGSTEYLKKQPDCVTFYTEHSFREASCGTNWLNAIGNKYGQGRWCLVIDADELFVFSPDYGETIHEFTGHIDATGAEGVFMLMIDMYATVPLSEITYQPGDPFTSACDQFDALGYDTLPVSECPYVNITGGVRQRLFYPEVRRRNLGDRLRWKIGNAAKQLPFLKNTALTHMAYDRPPVISKVPLVKWSPTLKHISNAHTVTDVKLFEARCALLHFKFFDDFHGKAVLEMKRGEHYGGGREYRRYAQYMNNNQDFRFTADVSRTYTDPQSLEECGIIHNKHTAGNPTDCSALR